MWACVRLVLFVGQCFFYSGTLCFFARVLVCVIVFACVFDCWWSVCLWACGFVCVCVCVCGLVVVCVNVCSRVFACWCVFGVCRESALV